MALLIRKALAAWSRRFIWRLSCVHARRYAGACLQATVKVRVGDKTAHTVADGDGPVNALDQALQCLRRFYPA